MSIALHKFVSFALVIALAAALFASCGTENGAEAVDAGASDGGAIHILLEQTYASGEDPALTKFGSFIKKLAKAYNSRNGDTIIIDTVDRELLSDSESVSPDFVDANYLHDYMYRQFASRRVDGKEPDIVIFSQAADYANRTDLCQQYTEWYKYIKNDYLADMTSLMESSGFQRGKYVEAVLDGGAYDGKQLFMPILYQMPMYGGTLESAAATGAPAAGTFSDFTEFWEQIGSAADYSLTSGVKLLGSYNRDYAAEIPLYGDRDVFDLASGGISADNIWFRTALSALMRVKDVKDCAYKDEYTFPYTDLYAVGSGKACMSISQKLGAVSDYIDARMGWYDKIYSDAALSTPYVSGLPSEESVDLHPALITLAMGISSTSENKDRAFDFIRFCMDSDELAREFDNDMYVYDSCNHPVNTELLRGKLDAAKESSLARTDAEKENVSKIADELYAELTSVSAAVPKYYPLECLYNSALYQASDTLKTSSGSQAETDTAIDALCEYVNTNLKPFFEQ